jgi:membrane protease YdiL (CAAX protease family)
LRTLYKPANGSTHRALTLGQVLVFYLICIFLGPILWQMMGWVGLDRFRPAVVDGGLYGILLIPLAYAFDRKIFSREYWHFPASGWIGVIILAVLQIMMMSGRDSEVEYYRAIGAVLVAPIVEELARAVMVSPLTIRLGSFWAIAITSALWAAAHNLFWIALVQQTVLTSIFVLTRKSLPSSITAHLVMNLIAVAYPRMHALFPHAFA